MMTCVSKGWKRAVKTGLCEDSWYSGLCCIARDLCCIVSIRGKGGSKASSYIASYNPILRVVQRVERKKAANSIHSTYHTSTRPSASVLILVLLCSEEEAGESTQCPLAL